MIKPLTAVRRPRERRKRRSPSNPEPQGLGAQVGDQGVSLRRPLEPQEDTEPARVAQAQAGAVHQHQVQMVMGPGRGRRGQDAQAPGHPQVDQQGPALQVQQQVLAPPPQGADGLALQGADHVRGHRVAQARLAYPQAGDAPTLQIGRHTAQGGLDLRQFGHGAPRYSGAGASRPRFPGGSSGMVPQGFTPAST